MGDSALKGHCYRYNVQSGDLPDGVSYADCRHT